MAEILEAFGYQYFFTESYFHNYNLILQERVALSSAWKSISAGTVSGTMTIICGTVIKKTVSGQKNVVIHGMMII